VSFSFADEGESAAPAAPAKKVVTDVNLQTADQDAVTGKVVEVMPADDFRMKPKIVVADQGGNNVEFVVKTLAVIYDASGALLALDEIQKGSNVEVHYRPISGAREATSIKVTK
jgi:hypothetical protein